MNHNYKNLPHKLLLQGATVNQGQGLPKQAIRLEDSAETVLTSFKLTRPFSITATATIPQVNDKMIACGVRMLFVGETGGDLHGLITYNDLFGEKPVRYIQEHGGRREDILVQDIMTPLAQLESLQHEDVIKARVGDIVETIKATGRQHMLVCITLGDGNQVITGLFSSTHIEMVLGVKIELSPRASSFADLERALTS